MKPDNENPISPTTSTQSQTKWCNRHPKLSENLICLGGLLLGGFPGGFMMWLVAGPVLRGNKLSSATIAELLYIAGGIAFLGVLLGMILAYATLIYKKISAIEARE